MAFQFGKLGLPSGVKLDCLSSPRSRRDGACARGGIKQFLSLLLVACMLLLIQSVCCLLLFLPADVLRYISSVIRSTVIISSITCIFVGIALLSILLALPKSNSCICSSKVVQNVLCPGSSESHPAVAMEALKIYERLTDRVQVPVALRTVIIIRDFATLNAKP